MHKLATIGLGTWLKSVKQASSKCPRGRLVQQVEHLGVSREIVETITTSHGQIQWAIEETVEKGKEKCELEAREEEATPESPHDFALDLQHRKVDIGESERCSKDCR